MKNKTVNTLTGAEKYKAVAFYLVRLHRVQPEGNRLKKTKQQIDDMSLATIEHMVENISDKVLQEYLSAEERRKN